MLATAIGVDGAVEGQVRRAVAGDDGFRRFEAHLGALGQRHLLVPAVVEGLRTLGREAVVRVGRGATAARGQGGGHGRRSITVFIYSNGAWRICLAPPG